jgi:hypothetical protein
MGKTEIVRRLSAVLLIASLLAGLGAVPGASAAAPAGACVDGFDRVAVTRQIQPEDVYAASAGKAIIAGGANLSGGRRAARLMRFQDGRWKDLSTRRLGRDAGYVALGGTRTSGLWAVGYWQTDSRMSPLVVRQRTDASWARRSVPSPGYSSVLTDVSSHKRSAAWAVGYRLGAPGTHRPLAMRWDGRRWSVRDPRLKAGERGLLAAVSNTAKGGTWAAGSTTRNGSERPYIARIVNGTWRRPSLPRVGPGALAAIDVPGKGDGWAVGYRISAEGMRPLVLRWDGRRWKRFTAPDLDGEALLYDVAVAGSKVSVAGLATHPTKPRLSPVLATLTGSGWAVEGLEAFTRDGLMTAVDGDPRKIGWTVGRDVWIGVAAHACEAAAPSRATRQAVRRERRAAIAEGGDTSGVPEHPEEARPAPRVDLAAAPRVELSAAGGVRIVDRAAAAGLARTAHTYGAVIRDFDKDGRKDIFLGGHADAAKLLLDRGATFERKAVPFGSGDRHGCAAADVDRSGLPDLYCSYGGARGLSAKANELWLDPGGPDPRRAADVGGAAEPLGRGRTAAFLDYDVDGRPDLVLGQQTNRVDGMPSLSRVYRWVGKGRFSLVRDPGLATAVGARAFDVEDFDRDGRKDLLMVSDDPRAAGRTSSVKLYRNTRRGLTPVHGARGIRSIGERDAELVPLDGDKRPDLVQLSADRIRISLQRDGRFKTVYERSLTKAVAVAAGDADGDGDRDLYVLRQKNRASVKDLIFFNRGNGRSFKVVAAPSRAGGTADDVYPIDHDQNGLTDFLVLNGRGSARGPLQLISFYR